MKRYLLNTAILIVGLALVAQAQSTGFFARIAVSDSQVHTVPAVASDTFTLNAATQTLTNKTVDAEGTGNLLTIPALLQFQAASCNNVTATSTWNLPAANAAVPTCQTGTNTNFATLNYPDGVNTTSAQLVFPVPADFTGAVDVRLAWFASATTGAAKWNVSAVCVSNGTVDPAFNTASTVTTTTAASANNQNVSSITGVTVTGCSSSTQTMFLKVDRDANNGADTLAVDARLSWAEFKVRRGM